MLWLAALASIDTQVEMRFVGDFYIVLAAFITGTFWAPLPRVNKSSDLHSWER